jgi:glycosyltransferase involved in cell wall biosynthesis
MKLKIVMLCDFFDPTLSYQENVLRSAFLSRGHSCSVVCAPEIDIFSYYQGRVGSVAGVKDVNDIYRLDYRFFLRGLKLLRGIRGRLEELRPDLLFVHDINLSLLTAILYVRENPRCILVCDCHCDKSNSARSVLSKIIVYYVIKRFVVWLAAPYVKVFYGVTPSCIEFMQGILGVPTSKSSLLPLCVDPIGVEERMASAEMSRFKASLGIPLDNFVVFTGGKLNERKGTHWLISAVRGRADVTVLICGEPESLGYKHELARLAATSSNIKFLGWQSLASIRKLMLCSHVGIFPGSQSVMWQQALGAGLPILVGASTDDGDKNSGTLNYLCAYGAVELLDERGNIAAQINQYISALKENPEAYSHAVRAANTTTELLLTYEGYIAEMESWWSA